MRIFSTDKNYILKFKSCIYDCYRFFLQNLAFYRGGSIIPRKERPRRASTLMRNDPYTLYVVLDSNVSFCSSNTILNMYNIFLQKSARGTLYTDDFESFEYREKKYLYLDFEFKDNTLRNRKIDDTNYQTEEWLERVVILGPPSGIKSATLKSKSICALISLNQN